MTPPPWADPELTSRGRAADARRPARRPPPARRPLAVPAAPPARRGARRRRGARPTSPAAGRCRTRGTTRSTPTSRCRSPIARRRRPRRTRPASTSASFEVPGGVGRAAASCSTSAPPRACSSVELNGQRRRDQQGLAPRGRVRRDGVAAAGRERPAADGREVVGRLVHRGPGPVVARRHHPPRVPVRDRARRTSRTS